MAIQLSDHFTYRRLLRFTLPSIAMMVFTSIYSVVDGFFVSNFAGKVPFTAVNLIYPLLMILASVGFMFGTGGSAVVAKTLGEGDPRRANESFSLIVYTALGLGLVLAVLGIVFLRPIAVFLGAEGEVLDCCVLYGRIILTALPFFVSQLLFQSFFITAERPRLGLYSSLSAGVTNMVLDAVLIPLLPMAYKLTGAAVASAMSMVVGGTIPLVYFSRRNTSLLRFGKPVFYGRVLGRAAVNGSSEFMSNVSMNLMAMLYNHQLLRYAGEDGVAAYGVMMYVSFVFASIFIGYTIGTGPVVSFHDGAGDYDELKGLLRKSHVLILSFSVAMAGAAELLASPLGRAFVGYDEALLALTVSGFRIFALSFLFMGFAIFTSGFFTALNDGLTSALISFLRTLVFETSAVLLLPRFFQTDGIWASIVAAELMAVLLSVAFLLGKRKAHHY